MVVLEGLAVVLAPEREYLDNGDAGRRKGTGQSKEIGRDRERRERKRNALVGYGTGCLCVPCFEYVQS